MTVSLQPRWDELAAAYERLGLDPLDQFMRERYNENLSRGSDPFVGIGTTTWLAVRAAVELKYNPVTIATGWDDRTSDRIRRRVLHVIETLCDQDSKKHPVTLVVGHSYWIPHLEKELTFFQRESQNSLRMVRSSNVLFVWDEWFRRAARRTQGPYSMVREIREEDDGTFSAWAEEDDFLFDLDPFGAQDLLNSSSEFILQRKQAPKIIASLKDFIPNANVPKDSITQAMETIGAEKTPTPTLFVRGSLSLTSPSAVTKSRSWYHNPNSQGVTKRRR